MSIRTKEQHRQRHIELHKALDELIADYMGETLDFEILKGPVMKLVNWSHKQTTEPDDRHGNFNDEPAPAGGRFRKRPVEIEAHQWFKNGDHPLDYRDDRIGIEKGEPRTWTGAEAKALGWEGGIVRYFRRPDVDGNSPCERCGNIMHVHGWIDTPEGGHTVCPGDWIITGIAGEHYPCKPGIFAKTYEPVAPTP
jgi:hypothetical protein